MNLENAIPDLGFILFNILTTVLLVVSIQKFRALTINYPGLRESKISVYLHLGMFLFENALMIAYVTLAFLD